MVAPDRPGLLWQAAGVLASHRLAVRSANATSCGDMAVTAFTVAHDYGEPPDAALVTSDLRRALTGQLDVAQRLHQREQAAARPAAGVAPPTVTLVDDASDTATVVEVRAHDAPGLLWRIGRALGECGLDVRAARVETLGAEAVDVFYVVDAGAPAGEGRGNPRQDRRRGPGRAGRLAPGGWPPGPRALSHEPRRPWPRPPWRQVCRSSRDAMFHPAGGRSAAHPAPDSLGRVFETLSDRLTQVFSSLRGRGRLSAADIDATLREIRIALLEADVALPVVREFTARVRERASSAEVSEALNPAQQVIKIVHEELVTILGGEARRLRFAKNPPTVIMLAGLQGSGKTTLAAKLALWLREQGNTPLLVAADLQRPNAVQQLQVLGEQAGVPVFAPEPGNGVGDPVAVARQSLDEARHRLHNIVIIDTAGRLGIDEEMMRQAAAIRDATDPDEILFVVDAMIGQDAVTTAQAFLDGVGYDGVVLTKLDGDARGGAALSIAQLTGRPVMFASTGEKLGDFDLFHPDRMASRILDMGDMLTLIEQAERTFDEEQATAMAGKLASGEGFTLEDFVEQLAMVRKLGPIGNLLGMLPGAAQNRELLSQVSDKDLDRAAAIVNSMTPGRTAQPQDSQRLAPRPHRPWLWYQRGRGEQPGHPVPGRPEDDAADVQRRWRARHAADPGDAARNQEGGQGPEGTGEEEAQGRPPRRAPAAGRRGGQAGDRARWAARCGQGLPGAGPGRAAAGGLPAGLGKPGAGDDLAAGLEALAEGTPVSSWCRKTISPEPGPPPRTCPPGSAASAAASAATASPRRAVPAGDRGRRRWPAAAPTSHGSPS